MNGADHRGAGLRAAVRAALAADDLEAPVRAVLERRFPAAGAGASLNEAGAALGMSPALVAHIEFAALCAIAAGRSRGGEAIRITEGGGE
jgi:hypothetical protein